MGTRKTEADNYKNAFKRLCKLVKTEFGFQLTLKKELDCGGKCTWTCFPGTYTVGWISIYIGRDSSDVMLWNLLHECGHAFNIMAMCEVEHKRLLNALRTFSQKNKVSKAQMKDEELAWKEAEKIANEQFGITLDSDPKYIKHKEKSLDTYRILCSSSR